MIMLTDSTLRVALEKAFEEGVLTGERAPLSLTPKEVELRRVEIKHATVDSILGFCAKLSGK